MQEFRREQWRMLLLTAGTYLTFYTGRQNLGFAVKAMQEELRLSNTTIGLITAALLVSYGIGQVVNGGLGDSRRPRSIVSVGALASVLLNWTVSFATSPLGVAIPWAANGYAQALGWAPCCRFIADWWPKKERGLAFGVLLLSAGCSSILTFALCLLTVQYLGWRAVFRFPVLLLGAGGALFGFFARDRPHARGVPLVRDGTAQRKFWNKSGVQRYRAVISSRPFRIATLSLGCESAARYGLLSWVPVHFLGAQWRQQPAAGWITLALPLGMAAGAAFLGWVSDRVFETNRTRPIAISLTLAAGVTLLLAWVPVSNWKLGAMLLLLAGFFVYGPQAAYWALCTEVVGKDSTATAVGVMDAFGYLFAGVAEILIGSSIDQSGSTVTAFYLISAVCLMGVFAILGVGRYEICLTSVPPGKAK